MGIRVDGPDPYGDFAATLSTLRAFIDNLEAQHLAEVSALNSRIQQLQMGGSMLSNKQRRASSVSSLSNAIPFLAAKTRETRESRSRRSIAFSSAVPASGHMQLKEAFQRITGAIVDEQSPLELMRNFEVEVCFQGKEIEKAFRFCHRTLCVEKIELFQEWNDSHPWECVELGDAVVGVGEVRDSPCQMLEEMRNGKLLLTMQRSKTFSFCFKNRRWTGNAIHLVVLHPQCDAKLVHALLQARGDIAAECHTDGSVNYDQAARAPAMREDRWLQAIHLATGCGNASVVEYLLSAQADVDATSRWRDGVPYYAPLHEAAFFNEAGVAEILLKHSADMMMPNAIGDTALHIAATQGAAAVAKLIVASPRFDLDILSMPNRTTNRGPLTPLDLAVMHSRFPYERLSLLAQGHFEEIVRVAKICPAAAREMMMRHRVDRNSLQRIACLHPLWNESVIVSSDDWLHIMAIDPVVASQVLMGTVHEPQVANEHQYALPLRAYMQQGVVMRCQYQPTDVWQCGLRAPSWHSHVAPQDLGAVEKAWSVLTQRRYQSVPVRMRVIVLPGIVNRRVMYSVANAPLRIFSKLAIQAVIAYVWDSLARRGHWIDMVFRAIELLVLNCWVWTASRRHFVLRPYFWTLLFAGSCRDLLYKCWELSLHIRHRNEPGIVNLRSYFGDYWNYLSLAALAMMQIFVWALLSSGGEGVSPHTPWAMSPLFWFSLVVSRWLGFVLMFQPFLGIGCRLLPLLHSFIPVGSMVAVTACAFAGLYFAFIAFYIASSHDGRASAFYVVYEFLFLGESDRFKGFHDAAIELWHPDQLSSGIRDGVLMFGTLVFTVCILNLFIAVHCESYDMAKEKGHTIFIKARASICCRCLFKPSFPETSLHICQYSAVAPCLLLVVIVSCFSWVRILTLEGTHDLSLELLAPACSLLVGFIGFDLLWLAQNTSSESDHKLWVCHRADFEEDHFAPAQAPEEESGLAGLQDRFFGLRADMKAKFRELKQDMWLLQENLSKRLKMRGDQTSTFPFQASPPSASAAAMLSDFPQRMHL